VGNTQRTRAAQVLAAATATLIVAAARRARRRTRTSTATSRLTSDSCAPSTPRSAGTSSASKRPLQTLNASAGHPTRCSRAGLPSGTRSPRITPPKTTTCGPCCAPTSLTKPIEASRRHGRGAPRHSRRAQRGRYRALPRDKDDLRCRRTCRGGSSTPRTRRTKHPPDAGTPPVTQGVARLSAQRAPTALGARTTPTGWPGSWTTPANATPPPSWPNSPAPPISCTAGLYGLDTKPSTAGELTHPRRPNASREPPPRLRY
jgi:hypothetical protein